MQFETYKEANKTGGNFYFKKKKKWGKKRELKRQCSVDKIKPYDRHFAIGRFVSKVLIGLLPLPLRKKNTSLFSDLL